MEKVDDRIGEHLRERRLINGMTLPEVGQHMYVGDEPHSSAAAWIERLKIEGPTKPVTNGLGKPVMAIEGVGRSRSAITMSEFLAVCQALDENPARVLERLGLADQAIITEDAIEGDPRISERDRNGALSYYRSLVRNKQSV